MLVFQGFFGIIKIFEIKEGEWAECVIHNISAGCIHTINSPYDEEILEHLEDWVCS